MGKRKRSFRPPPTYETGNDKFDDQSGRIKEITTWDDVEHDSEDEFYAGRDQISLDTHESHKHDESEFSEEEVFALETAVDSDGEDENELNNLEEDDSILDSMWGSRKENYYNADEISNLDDAKEEEEAALKLQRKRISQMTEDDFLELDGESLESSMIDRKRIESTDNDLDLMSFDMKVLGKEHQNLSRDDIIEIIQSESPELIELLNEFEEKSSILRNTVTPLLEKARQKNLIHNPAMKFISIKHQTLVHYLINISFYLALKSFGTQHLREHPVIDALVKLKMTLVKLERLERKIGGFLESFVVKEDWSDHDNNMADDLDKDEEPIDPIDFYNMVKEAKNAAKEQRKEQFEMEHCKNKIVYEDVIPEGAKRQINYQILKNKGLTPHRKKEQRNPRVKHKNKYEKARKKIKSIKRVISQQEGSYGGEKTGIKTGLSRSIKLD
ncbi:20366_t:CDS:2 [Cetraspora pellucida]|uniref:20366_t:CDS:1 n=1 Tax=Cetraspora pellucida TaxID=1433469 RepID=A0A9N9AAS3_9GLOM|nr:20366_t:CDS:2 [Cetraspora pellucida]